MDSQYIFNNVEVVLTGRTAKRQLKRKVDILHEIKPADPENGSWTKWVRIVELYEITD